MEDGNTALMHAVYNNHAACVQELLSAGADFTILNETLDSAFDIAVKKRSKHGVVFEIVPNIPSKVCNTAENETWNHVFLFCPIYDKFR